MDSKTELEKRKLYRLAKVLYLTVALVVIFLSGIIAYSIISSQTTYGQFETIKPLTETPYCDDILQTKKFESSHAEKVKEIVEWGKENNKTEKEIVSAVLKYKQSLDTYYFCYTYNPVNQILIVLSILIMVTIMFIVLGLILRKVVSYVVYG
jgi:hypothetical protein